MSRFLPVILVIGILAYALYLSKSSKDILHKNVRKDNPGYSDHPQQKNKTLPIKEELEKIHTDEYVKTYIVNVIKQGSNQFNFPGGEMEGGFVPAKDAPKIACYVLSLSGKQCRDPYPEDAAMFYTSVCGGCHGNDGKGMNGSYPDLTKSTLLGIKKRETLLQTMLKKP